MDNKYKQLIDIALDTKDYAWAKELTETAIIKEKFKDITDIKMLDKAEINKLFKNKSKEEKLNITFEYMHDTGMELGNAIKGLANYILSLDKNIEKIDNYEQ